MAVCAITLLIATFVLQVPNEIAKSGTPVSGPADAAYVLWPQGWILFSGGEDQPEIVAYRQGADGWASALVTPEAQAGDLWGLARGRRVQVREVEALYALIPDASWRSCDAKTGGDCLQGSAPPGVVAVTNPAAHPSLCGRIALTTEALDPWGRDRSPGRALDRWRVERVAVLDVACR